MSIDTWGLVPKAQDNNQTIDEAIAIAIAAHEADSASHLGDGESLQSHRASDIIDHLAESIVADKYADFSVSENKMARDKLRLETDFTDISHFFQYKTLTGAINNYMGLAVLSTGATINSNSSLRVETYSEGYGPDWFKNPIFFCIAKCSATSAVDAYIQVGEIGYNYFGFHFINGALKCFVSVSGVKYESSAIAGINYTIFHRYRIVYTSGSKIEFYVDDVLIYTESTHLPEQSDDTADELVWWRVGIKNTAAGDKDLFVRYILYAQDL